MNLTEWRNLEKFTTVANFKQLAPRASDETLATVVKHFPTMALAFGMTSMDFCEEFLGQMLHESGGFTILAENLNYSAKRLMQVWPNRFPTIEIANRYANNPQKLGAFVYNGRNGNVKFTDGYNLRGSGYFQLTGRTAIEAYGDFLGLDIEAEQLAQRLQEDVQYALHSAFWCFAVYKKLLPLADADDYRTITRRINGGLIGWEDRMLKLEQIRKLFLITITGNS